MDRESQLKDFIEKGHVDLVSSMTRLVDDAHRADDEEALADLRVVWDNYNKLIGVAEVLANDKDLVAAVHRIEALLDNKIRG